MYDVPATLRRARDQLAGGGLPTSLEPAGTQVPGAWLSARSIVDETIGGGAQLRCYLYLLAGDVGVIEAHDILAGLLDIARTVLVDELADDEDISTAEAVALPDTSPLPAYRVTVDLDLEVRD